MRQVTEFQKDKIVELQKVCTQFPQLELEEYTTHVFNGGIYARMLFRKKGTTIVGKVHKKEHLYMVMSGTVIVTDGGEPVTYTGPCIIKCKPGTKRAVFALTDATCTYVCKTDYTEVCEELENDLVEDDEYSLYDARNKLKFDNVKFRELTSKVIAAEKPGFWSDWAPEQQQLYTEGKWKEFSISRGYTEQEINDYSSWRDMIAAGIAAGFNPYICIKDLTEAAALKNIALDGRGEILKSSHLPFERRIAP
jgi:hypothetical protein